MRQFFIRLFALSVFLICLSGNAQVDCDKLFDSFKQGDTTNCASIAFIKAALNIYGLDQLFLKERSNEGYKITLKNNEVIYLSDNEIKQAEISADFKILNDRPESKEIKDYAVLCYAAMAKYKEKLEEYKTYAESLQDLEYGAQAKNIYKYLGFERGKNIMMLRRLGGKGNKGLVAWSPYHAVFACEGYMDYHGKKTELWFKYSGRFIVIKEQ